MNSTMVRKAAMQSVEWHSPLREAEEEMEKQRRALEMA